MHSLKGNIFKAENKCIISHNEKLYTIFSLNSNVMLFLCKVALLQNAVMPL